MQQKTVGNALPSIPKKLLSIILSLCMLFSITAGLDFPAYATSRTQSEAVIWVNSQIGKSLDYDGVNGAQCVDLTKYYYAYLGVTPVRGSGCDYATNSLPSGWQRIKYYSGFVAQPGDIAVWTYLSTSSGHVAIVTSANSSTMSVVDQYGISSPAHIVKTNSFKYSSGTFYGVIRPNFASGSTGETITPTISDDKNYVVVGENITFTYSGLSVCSKASFFFEKDGEVYYSYDSTSSRTFTTYFEKPGVYYVFSGGYINGNWYYSDKIRVDVFEPKLVVNKNTVNQKELLTFTYSGLTSCGRVIICFEKDGKVYYTDDVTANVDYKTYFENTGVYYVYVVGYISNYSCKSNKVKVTVNCSHQTTITIPSVKPTCVKAGKSEGKKCSECGTVLTYQSTILATGHTYSNACDTTCNTCGATRTTSHSYDNGKITKQPTCTSTGTKTYTCSVCGATKTSTISAKGHNYNDGVVTWYPTCTEEGTKVYTCTGCGATKTETIPAKGHTVVTDKAVKATYAKAGKTEGKHCKTCGKVIVAQKSIAKLTVSKITLSSVKSKKSKQITVTWKKNTKVTGYEIQYATNNKFTKNKKTVTVSKNSTTSKTITKLKSKTKYYVRVRAYKVENGKKYYSSWSSSKTITTKK